LGCECYDQKYIIVTYPEDSPRTWWSFGECNY